jgi:hypothetical protein
MAGTVPRHQHPTECYTGGLVFMSNCSFISIILVIDRHPNFLQLFRQIHVNIYDLVNYKLTRKPAKQFPTVRELAYYCRCYNKFFPRNQAKADQLLKCLLRRVLDPEDD